MSPIEMPSKRASSGRRSTRRGVGGEAIGSVSSLLGVPVPTIRSWERRYGYPAPERTKGRHRRYSQPEIEQIRALRDLITTGYPTREAIARLARGEPSTGDSELREDAVAAAMHLDPEGLRRALDRAAERLGVEDAIRSVVLPTMRDIGSRWKTGNCEVEHEHIATQEVRAWLARLSAMAPPPFRPYPIVLACGPKDLHTIGLEAFGVVLARRGWATRTLGAMTPTASLLSTVRAVSAIGAVVVAQRNVTRRAAVESIVAIDAVPGVRIFYAGDAFAAPVTRRRVAGTYLGDDLVSAAEVLEAALGGVGSRRRSSSRGTSGSG